MNRIRKVDFFVSNDLTYDQRMQRICTALAEQGHRVTLVGRKRKSSIEVDIENVSTRRFHCLFNKGPLFYLELNVRIFWYILWNTMDIAVSIDLDTISGVLIASRIKRIPVIFDAHEWFVEVPELIGRPRVKKAWKIIENYCVPRTTKRYTVNESLAEIFTEQFNLKFHTIRNVPLKMKFPELEHDANKRIIIYQGALNKGRGIEQTLEAMKSLDKYELWLVGEGDLSSELRALTGKWNLKDRVRFYGYKTPEQLKTITPLAAVGLNLLEGESKNYYYSLANKFFDYMQAGVPSLNMRFPEYEHILNDYKCGRMIESCSVALIVNEVKQMCENESQFASLKKEAKRASEVFTWENEKQKLVRLFEEI